MASLNDIFTGFAHNDGQLASVSSSSTRYSFGPEHSSSSFPPQGNLPAAKKCLCEYPAQRRTVSVGVQTGTEFLCCGNPNAPASHCTFFEWISANNSFQSSATGSSLGSSSSNGVGEGRSSLNDMFTRGNDSGGGFGGQLAAPPKCKCNMETRSFTVKKEGPNTGKTFYVCPKEKGEQCRYFEFEEDLLKAGGGGGGGGGGAGNGNRNTAPSGGRGGNFAGASSRGGGAGGDNKCWKCKESGHWAGECPNPNKNGKGGGGASFTCFKCGQPGHYSNKCPSAM